MQQDVTMEYKTKTSRYDGCHIAMCVCEVNSITLEILELKGEITALLGNLVVNRISVLVRDT